MSNGRTYWQAQDAGWWRREWIVTLGIEFGAAGPAVINWLECEAKAQNDGGWVKAGPRTVARGSFVDDVTVGHVLSRAVTLGLLADYEESNGRFTCRIWWWKADQERAGAASRKANQRGRESTNTDDSPPDVTVGHGESRSVTECPPTGQDRRGEESQKPVPASPAQTPEQIAFEERVEFLCSLLSTEVRIAHSIPTSSREAIVTNGWRGACRGLLTSDAFTAEQVEFAIRWVCKHHYWSRRVKSMTRLRKEMAMVIADIKRDRDGGGSVVRLTEKQERQARRLAAMERVTNGGATA